jgi:hypothetical protein
VIAQLEAFLKKDRLSLIQHQQLLLAPPIQQTTTFHRRLPTPITSLTPLQTSFRNPNSEITFVGDLTPILPEEMPPSNFFFSKKGKSIVKRESHQKDGVITKRKRLVYDENDQDDPEFAKEVAGSLGAFSTANQWSVDNLTEQLRQKCLLVEHLQNQIYTMSRLSE